MQTLTKDKKKYVFIEEKQLTTLQQIEAKNVTPHKKLSLSTGKNGL